MHALLFLESIGTTELLVILVAALILFGPRKLPELSRSLGKSLSEFKRASDDFKRTWEREVALEQTDKRAGVERAMIGEPDLTLQPAPTVPAAQTLAPTPPAPPPGESIARNAPATDGHAVESVAPPPPVSANEPSRKSDWL